MGISKSRIDVSDDREFVIGAFIYMYLFTYSFLYLLLLSSLELIVGDILNCGFVKYFVSYWKSVRLSLKWCRLITFLFSLAVLVLALCIDFDLS